LFFLALKNQFVQADGLYAGVPLLTLPGGSMASRLGAGVAVSAGQARFGLAHSAKEYEDHAAAAVAGADAPAGRACAAAGEGTARPSCALGQSLRAWRAALAAGQGGSGQPLWDTAGYAARLEEAVEAAWRRHEAGLSPAAIG
jgi:predicted O-linked N-acetylglucosamine transferase (SPINDLY family)